MNKMTVLLVDASESLRNELRRAIEREPGLRVVGETGNQTDAMQLFFTLHPDVVIIGVCLKDSSGFDTLAGIRTANSRCPLILIGDPFDTFVAHVGRVFGATDVCSKDDDFKGLLQGLRKVAGMELHKPPVLERIAAA